MVSFNMTNDSITVIYKGKSHVVQRGTPHFTGLRKAIIEENWDDVPNHLSLSKSLTTWAKGKFTLNESTEKFSYDGRELPPEINQRIIAMATAGEDPTPMFNFFERLNKNPSMRSVEQLYPFLQHSGIAVTKDGCFLAYKGVRGDYKDCHTETIDNRPGQVVKVQRNQVSDDPRQACHFGLHAGSRSFASSYGTRMLVVKIDPEHVVCVPYDSSQKLRCCEYKVIGNHGEDLPDTVADEDDLPADAPEQSDPADENDEAFNGDLAPEDAPLPETEEVGSEIEDSKLFDAENGEFVKEEEEIKTAGNVAIPKKYAALAMKSFEELMKQPLDKLRELATYGLKIIGASKVPGGKAALIAKIIEVRGTKE